MRGLWAVRPARLYFLMFKEASLESYCSYRYRKNRYHLHSRISVSESKRTQKSRISFGSKRREREQLDVAGFLF